MYLVESTYQIITKYKTDTPISIYYLVNSPYIVYEAHNKGQDSFFLYKLPTTTYFRTQIELCMSNWYLFLFLNLYIKHN